MKKKLSITDIAEKLGISTTTVSFILNGRAKEKRISESLIKEVEDFISKVGYKPNSLARSFRTGRTHIIGLMVEDMSNAFFSTIARLIEEKSYQNGYRIIYCSTENNPTKTDELLQMYKEWHVDGYIIVPPEGIENNITSLIKSGKPVVQLDRYLTGAETDSVVTNNYESTYQATKHLIEGTYKNIAFVTTDSKQHQMQDRLHGYERALSESKLPKQVLKVIYNGISPEKQITTFLQKEKDIDALFFATNYLCVSGLKAFKKLNLNIPNDVGIISFDDHELFELYSPSITTVAQPIEQIAEHTINMLLTRLKSETCVKEFNHVVLPTTFIPRLSSIKQ